MNPKTRANIDAFAAWLDGITLTKPVTLEDKRELMTMVKDALKALEVRVDVYSRRDPAEIYLRIEYPDTGKIVERTYRAV